MADGPPGTISRTMAGRRPARRDGGRRGRAAEGGDEWASALPLGPDGDIAQPPPPAAAARQLNAAAAAAEVGAPAGQSKTARRRLANRARRAERGRERRAERRLRPVAEMGGGVIFMPPCLVCLEENHE